VQFTLDSHAGLASGAITVTFRIWKRPQAKVGSRHKVGDVVLEIDRVDRMPIGAISEADAKRAGARDRDEVIRRLAQRAPDLDSSTLVYRVEFHRAGSFDELVGAEQSRLSDDELADVVLRLDRLDRASPRGPWTRETLRSIAERPGVVSTELAEALGRDRPSFKLDVRKLKRLGLTHSLVTGYEITPKGAAVLASLEQ
jgi:hypothetical protein